jgi:SAM-dependent methyltransferase
MTDWTSGYVADIGYTFGYYAELNPLRVPLAFANHGLAASPGLMGATEATACELGFGQGLSANIHAAASSVSWWGTDFNPSQAAFAQSLAAASGAGASLFDEAFAEFCNRSDLPEFDFIGVHGIWSWISDENRFVLVDFIRRKLKVGGVLYISYNTLPGWAAFAPMRHLMTEHAEILGAEGRGIVSRIDGAIDFADKLLALNPTYLRANPLVSDRLTKMKEHNRHYLAHEYFNRDWHPMHFATMAQWLEPAKLQYACSANYLDAIDAVNLTPEQQQFLNEIPDPMFRQTTRDFMVNQQFRKDYWVKGARRLSPLEQSTALRAQRVMLTNPLADVALKVTGSLGEATLSEAVYQPVLNRLADHQPYNLAELEASVAKDDVNFAQLQQAVMVLYGAGHLSSVQESSSGAAFATRAKCVKALNAFLTDKARGSGEVGFLASALTGGGIPVNRFQQLFLLAISLGKKTPEDWAAHTWDILAAQGQWLIKDGKQIESVEDNLAELKLQAWNFADNKLQVLRAAELCIN